MALPTITSITPSQGPTGGQTLVEIRGSGFRTWVIPPFVGRPSDPIWPTVGVYFGGSPGARVQVISSTRLYVLAPPSPLALRKPSYGEGPVDVQVKNLTQSGAPIAGEAVAVTAGYSYSRIQLGDETTIARLCREVVRQFRLQTVPNVSLTTHSDFDISTEDLLNIVDVAEVPAIVLFGPDVAENRFFSLNGYQTGKAQNFELDEYNVPDTSDLTFAFAAISNQKEEAIAIQELVIQFFKRNRWIYLLRDPAQPELGHVYYDLVLNFSAGLGYQPTIDQKSNIRTFSGSFTIRGFDHEAFASFPLSDRTARLAQFVPHHIAPPDSGQTPSQQAANKSIVAFQFPDGVGSIGDTTIRAVVPIGTDRTALVPTITHTGVSVSPQSGAAQDFTTPVTYVVTAANGSTKSYTVTVDERSATSGMALGSNFWYHSPPNANFSGESSMVSGINWASAYGSGTNGLADTNIWNPTFLNELQPYSVLRFMDWSNINWSTLVAWSQRRLPIADNYEAYIDGATTGPNPGVAYEWLIDLANRRNADLWICVPPQADDDFVLQLATLLKNKLQTVHKLYIEYGNENWNDDFGQKQYTIDRGVALALPGINQFYKGQSFAVLRSLQIFEIFKTVFGAVAMGTRVVRVFAYGGNMDTGRQALRDVYQSVTYNTTSQVIDMLAIAPYIGRSLDGAAPTIQAQFHADIDNTEATVLVDMAADKTEFAIAALGCYEGGQHLLVNSMTWTQNPVIYDEYRYMLDRWAHHFDLFVHYTHTGTWTNDSNKSSWGALDHTGQPLAEIHKYRALVDWKLANP